jgi:putative DNA primase/helicase
VNVDEILGQLERVRKNKRGWMALCPAHEDSDPSLSIAEGDDGRVLLRCFAGCPTDRVCASLGIKISDLFPDRGDRRYDNWRP